MNYELTRKAVEFFDFLETQGYKFGEKKITMKLNYDAAISILEVYSWLIFFFFFIKFLS